MRRFTDVSGVTIREVSSDAVSRVFGFFCGGKSCCADVDGSAVEGCSDFRFCSACWRRRSINSSSSSESRSSSLSLTFSFSADSSS